MDEKEATSRGAGAHAEGSGTFDREIDLRTILIFGAALVGVTLFVLLVMWWMSASFKTMDQVKDPRPSPISEAQLDPMPPGPRLQPVPPRDMDELRADDRKILTTYGWVDQAHGVARIPVDRAIAILAEKGLPATPAAAVEAAAEEATAGSSKPAAEQPAAHEAGAKPKAPHKKKEKEPK